ncbi:hypothetical protein [Streptomyces sp. NBC_00582]|uniref:hypothetical protein n=1 Tax=Streptomyces sp. NBC_00582 TaxID=2975783 RepID=UPI001063DEFB|nr:hypothetical protein [Streptomyces sp. NBC_00582]WUB62780.1 hypothetical protein OG852_21450 [Streptomyces sp. NBC_00582]
MTSAIYSRGTSRRPVRAVAAAAALAGALALTGCGGGSDDDGSAAIPSASAGTATAGTGGSGSGSGGATASASSELEGNWLTTADGDAVALIITGKQAALFATGGTVCSGTASASAGMKMIYLKCPTGSKDRTTGMVDSIDGDTMKVTWSGAAGKETYTKAENGRLPSGLPTAALGSS